MHLLHWQAGSLPLKCLGIPNIEGISLLKYLIFFEETVDNNGFDFSFDVFVLSIYNFHQYFVDPIYCDSDKLISFQEIFLSPTEVS